MGIQYKLDSIAPHFSQSEMDAMARMITLDLPKFFFDSAYVEQVKQFNGGEPENKYFKTKSGRCLPIDRFLNYSDTRLISDRAIKILNANVVWSMIEDRLGPNLLPFAAIPNGDFLCFDYRQGENRPAVVLWSHESSTEDHPSTLDVASNFDEFVNRLSMTYQQ